MKLKFLLLYVVILVCQLTVAQTKKDYIYAYASVAVEEMEYAKIPASITLAQGILESRFGLSELSTTSNNHFGIKCHKGWNGGKTYYDDDAKGECFRKYSSVRDSFRDHSEFLLKPRYSDLFKLSKYDYKSWAKGLKKAGYATNPNYANHLIKIIEEEQLYVFDRMSAAEVGPYIASLENHKQQGEVMWAKAEATPVKVNQPEPVNAQSLKDVTIEIIGGPAAAPEDDVAQSRDIFIVNDIKTIRSFNGDTKQELAQRYNVPYHRLAKYNEWEKYGNEFLPGMKVYLQPKRSKNRDVSQLTHIVQPDETMYQIAQQYGLRTDKLYQRNLLNEEKGEQPHPGEIIQLRKSRDSKPKLLDPSKVFTEQNIRTLQDDEGEAIGRIHSSEEDVEQFIEREIEEKQPQTKDNKHSEEIRHQTNSSKTTTSLPKERSKPVVQQSTISQPVRSRSQKSYLGRAIIYQPTPAVNLQPVYTSLPSNRKLNYSASQQNHSKPVATLLQYHRVVKGDTLYGLAKKYGVSVQQIIAWNNLKTTTIKLGQRIIVSQ